MQDEGPQLKDGFTRIAHKLLEAVATAEIPKRMKEALLFVIRGTYGSPGSPKTAEFDLVVLAGKLGSTTQLLRRNLQRLLAVGMITVEKSRLGVWRLGPQKLASKWVPWSVIADRERASRGHREKQLSLIETAPRGAVGGTSWCRPAAPGGAAARHQEVPSRLHKLQPVQNLQLARDRDIRKTETDVVPDAVVAARAADPDPATTRLSSTTPAGKPPPSASNDGALFPPGFFESEAVRAGAERRLRAALEGGLETYARPVAEEIYRSALRAKDCANPRRYVSGLIGRRDRVREIAAGFESRAAEARAAAERPPEGGPPRGGGAPQVRPSPSAKDGAGYAKSERPQAGRMDPFAFLVALGLEIGRAA